MALLPDFMFDPQSFQGGLGGLLSGLGMPQQFPGQNTGFQLPGVGTPSFSDQSFSPSSFAGSLQPSPMPQAFPSQAMQFQPPDNGQLPMQAQPTAGASPMAPPAPPMNITPPGVDASSPQGPGFMGGISNALNNHSLMLMALGAGTMQGGFGKGLQLAGTAAQAENKTGLTTANQIATMQALIAKGVDPATARVMATNSGLLTSAGPQALGLKTANSPADVQSYEYAQQHDGYKGTLADWIAQKRGGAGEYGLQPVYGTGPDGKPVILQVGKSGKAIQSQLPEGVTLTPGVTKVDAGDHWAIVDNKSGNLVGSVPKNIAAAKVQAAQGTAQGTASTGLQNALDQGQQTLDTIDQIQNHPGRKSMFSTGMGGMAPAIPGTDQAGFVKLVDQLKGKTFLQAYTTLKGAGAITEVEGKKAEDAIGRLDRTQNDKDFNQALSDLRNVIKIGMQRSRNMAGGRFGNPDTLQPTQAGAPSASPSASAPDPLGLR